MIINCGHPRRVFVFKLTFARIAIFSNSTKNRGGNDKETFVCISPHTSKTLMLGVFELM